MSTAKFVVRWNKPEGAWLVLAILAHALLLFIPLKTLDYRAATNSTLSVRLTSFLPVVAPIPPSPVGHAEEKASVEISTVKEPRISVPEPEFTKPFTGHEPYQKPAQMRLTSAQLIASARLATLDRPRSTAVRVLGVYNQVENPPNWQSGEAVQSYDNLFAGMIAPARTEIVDHWLAADGSQNVVLNLPNGETVCGRGTAFDPLKPLVEHVMMYRTCGGGGKRTFSMVIPESRSREVLNWAASD